MADNFLEKRQAEYEKRKEQWLKKKKHILHSDKNSVSIEKPDDETL